MQMRLDDGTGCPHLPHLAKHTVDSPRLGCASWSFASSFKYLQWFDTDEHSLGSSLEQVVP